MAEKYKKQITAVLGLLWFTIVVLVFYAISYWVATKGA